MVKFNIQMQLGGIKSTVENRADDARKSLKFAVLESCKPFVPYYTGELCKSGSVVENGVKWFAGHASKCYYADREFSKRRHPRATARWFEAAKSESLDDWKALVWSAFGI